MIYERERVNGGSGELPNSAARLVVAVATCASGCARRTARRTLPEEVIFLQGHDGG